MLRTWNDRLDARLLKAKEDGASFSEAALRLGVSRSAALGRYHRLAGTRFPSQQCGSERTKYQQERAAAQWKESAAIRELDLALSCGANRDNEIRRAYAAGCSLAGLSRHIGVSDGRIWQIVKN